MDQVYRIGDSAFGVLLSGVESMVHHQSTRLRPEVAVILDAEKKAVDEFKVLDLREKAGQAPNVWIERGINPGDYNLDPRKYFL